jgi:hypothetical protein
MYAATIESTNKAVVGASKAAAPSSKAAAKVEDNKLLKRKLRETDEWDLQDCIPPADPMSFTCPLGRDFFLLFLSDEWKDHSGKTHVKHLQAFTACKSMYAIMWKLHDAFRAEAE